ncbi:portal protein [Lysinibacillus xylanilyticus]|uniref:Phage portal protein n=1 Tax=Lysinibacillus xylanilyticus TaxID=582475 RepID=A0ABT4EM95_9BACI|nr:portal protein [Lysinibacillus xylanilyticus]MCY9546790.1 phage portal protein [Lysinibacillus xylanilyticus]
MNEVGTVTYNVDTFKPGEQFPPANAIERIAKYRRMKKLYDGKQAEIYERATSLLRDTPHAPQLEKLYIAVNIADPIITKVPDLLVGEPPIFDSGLADDSPQQTAINSYVEENDLVKLIHESALANGYRGDSWFKVRYDYRQDYSVLTEMGLELPIDAEMEPIIEHVAADCVFPQTSAGNVKSFKSVVIASVEWVVTAKEDIPFLNVERHLPGYIINERYKLQSYEGGIDTSYGYPVQLFKIVEKVGETTTTETGVPHLLVHHIPYKSTDDQWEGKGTLEALESILIAINDRLVQLDYILWKHSDPTAYGPELGTTGSARLTGAYIPLTAEDKTPGYMTWDGQLNSAFKELETLIGMAFQIAETPQWLFGTVLGDQNAGGTGTSHTDGAAIKARFMPILTKVARIRTHYDRALRDALYNCQLLDIAHGEANFEAVYPTIQWQDGLPHSEKEQAEIMAIRTGNKPTIDVATAIKRLDSLDDLQAAQIIERIKADTEREVGTVDASIFNDPDTETDEGTDA